MQNHIDKMSIIDLEPDYKQILHDVRIQMHTIASAMQVMGRYMETRALPPASVDLTFFHDIISEAVIKGIGLLNAALPVRGENAQDEAFCAALTAKGIINALSVLAESMNSSLIYRGPERCLLPHGKSKFERILYNLVSNAINHTPSGTDILVELERCADGIRIAVTDHGDGLSPLQTDVLCSPRPFPANTENHYGLRNIRNLTDDLGGHIVVNKNSDDKMNNISVFIPCTESLAQIQKIRHNIP